MDTIADADPFVRGSTLNESPQDYATYSTPNSSTSSLAEGQKMFGRSGQDSFLPPYLIEDVAKSKGLQPTQIPFGGTAHPGTIPLATPADMDGHFLQKFDNALVGAEDEEKQKLLARFM